MAQAIVNIIVSPTSAFLKVPIVGRRLYGGEVRGQRGRAHPSSAGVLSLAELRAPLDVAAGAVLAAPLASALSRVVHIRCMRIVAVRDAGGQVRGVLRHIRDVLEKVEALLTLGAHKEVCGAAAAVDQCASRASVEGVLALYNSNIFRKHLL